MLARTRKIIAKSEVPIGDELSTAKELSTLFIQLGKYSQTEELLDNLILEYEALFGNTSLRLIDPLVNKGKIMLAKGDYTEADRIARRANELAVKIEPAQRRLAAHAKRGGIHDQIYLRHGIRAVIPRQHAHLRQARTDVRRSDIRLQRRAATGLAAL